MSNYVFNKTFFMELVRGKKRPKSYFVYIKIKLKLILLQIR